MLRVSPLLYVIAQFSFIELNDIHYVYGETKGNGRVPALIHQKQFPDRHHRLHKIVATIYKRLDMWVSFVEEIFKIKSKKSLTQSRA